MRALVSNTDFGKYLNPAVVEYFTEELFEERNPILHGSVADYHSELNAAKKIVFFRNLIEDITNQMVQLGVDQVVVENSPTTEDS